MIVDLFDVVILNDGRKGTIIEKFDGNDFMLEITDDKGQTIDNPIINHKDIKEITYKHKG